MKTIKLLNLSAENFKGFRQVSFDFGDLTSVYGPNASGKTSMLDGFQYVMFGKDSQGKSDFQRRPVDENGQLVDNVDISVSATLAITETDPDGNVLNTEEVTFRKVERQNWVRHRGDSGPTFQGNVTDYFINEFPSNKRDYEERIASIISEELFRLLTSPKHFANLKWQEQRTLLFRMISGITDADIIALNEEMFAPIKDDVLAAGAEKAKEKAAVALKKLREEQKGYPIRIDEASRSIVDIDVPALSEKKTALEEQLKAVEAQKAGLIDGTAAVRNIQAEIMQTKLDAESLKAERSAKLKEMKLAVYKQLSEKQSVVEDLNRKMVSIERERDRYADQCEADSKLIERATAEYKEVRSRAFDTRATICPTCGREFQAEKVADIKNRFELLKEQDTQEVLERGRMLKKRIEATTAEIEKRTQEVIALTEQLKQVNAECEVTAQAYNAMTTEPDMEHDAEYMACMSKIADLEKQLASANTANEADAYSDRINAIKADLDEVNALLACEDSNKRAHDRIRQLQEEQRDCGQAVADQEQIVYLLEEFVKLKMNTLSDHINARFKNVRFKLFEQLINGGMKETCVMQINSNGSYVDYANANSAGQIQGGIDVINALSDLYGVSAPIWIDNRESCTVIPEVNGQVINLIVSPDDKSLRIEKE